MTAALALAAVAVGAAMQRITGVGFALVAAPFLVLLLGPVEGVLVLNLSGALTSALLLAGAYKRVDWRMYLRLIPAAFVGIGIGTVVVGSVPGPVLDIVIGGLLAAALTALILLRERRLTPARWAAPAAGIASGVMNTTAGLGGPAITIYAVATRWPQASFAATAQAYFLTIAATAFGTKTLLGVGSVATQATLFWILIVVASLAGVLIGSLLAGRISPARVRTGLFVVSYAGAAATIVRGVLEVV